MAVENGWSNMLPQKKKNGKKKKEHTHSVHHLENFLIVSTETKSNLSFKDVMF